MQQSYIINLRGHKDSIVYLSYPMFYILNDYY